MKKIITTLILVRNNEQTIQKCLDSIKPLGGSVIIGDLGSKDNTLNICKRHGKVYKFNQNNDLGKIRNDLTVNSETKWNFWIEPWEFLARGHEVILESIKLSSHNCYEVAVIQPDLIQNELRLWKADASIAFQNPINEILVAASVPELLEDVIIVKTKNDEICYEEKLRIIEEWKNNKPLDPDPYYHQCMVHLFNKKYKEFTNIANYYLFKQPKGLSAVLTRYYLSQINLYVFKDANKALQEILTCIAMYPLVAEFWCLLGDIYYKAQDYSKARSFYENAIFLGSRRLKNDGLPIQISKYKQYPEKMIENCENILKETEIFGVQSE